MEIYAPLANRLGIWELNPNEDLAFRYINPEAYESIRSKLDVRGRDQAAYIERIKQQLKDALAAEGIEVEALRPQQAHLFNLPKNAAEAACVRRDLRCHWHPNDHSRRPVERLLRSARDHSSMRHLIPGEIDDYIATPKQSMYQSLHTAVIGAEGRALEIQIRTRQMHEVAEYGVAAHWRYKEGNRSDAKVEAKIAWLRQLLEWQTEVKDAEEFVENVKSDMLEDMIYVSLPRGHHRVAIGCDAARFRLQNPYRDWTPHGSSSGQRPTGTTRYQAAERAGRRGRDQQGEAWAEPRLVARGSRIHHDRVRPRENSAVVPWLRSAEKTSPKARRRSSANSGGLASKCAPKTSTSTSRGMPRSRTCSPRSATVRFPRN